ncbi:death-associated inhibitor of apoptosis 1-like, partial [Temnothorax curvispinosus]|uniref:Death-associated inhibitor of apoptosis 1-like n=1 Tax=Temnothorax curvispinosus TaxID=300111 RepID=A0A6J1QN88_9HYME
SCLPPSSPIKSHLSSDETYDDKHYAILQSHSLLFDERYEDLFESTRLKSFKNWPWISGLWIKPEKLAAAGFYYTGESDKIQCFECPIEIYGKWQVDDNPVAYHQQWSGECRFIRNIPCGNVPIGTDPNTIPAFVRYDDVYGIFSEGYYSKGLVICKLKGMASRPKRPGSVSREASIAIAMALRPKHPEYASYAVRLASFDRWPKAMSQTKETLATAGFYYTGSGDQTLCYHCGEKLRDWEPEDDPWVKHVGKRFEYCPYVYLIKGTEFVSSISGRTGIRAENILSEINKLNEKIEKNIDAESIASGSSQNSIYSEETNTAEVSAASGEASSEQQSVQGDKRCDMEPCKICYSREVRILFMP